MKKFGMLCMSLLACLSLAACSGQSHSKSSAKKTTSSKAIKKHHHKKHSKKKKADKQSSSSANKQNQASQQQSQPQQKQGGQGTQQQTQPSSIKGQDDENLHLTYSDNANNGKGGLVAVYSHGDDPQTNRAAEQYGQSIAQNGGSGDYRYN